MPIIPSIHFSIHFPGAIRTRYWVTLVALEAVCLVLSLSGCDNVGGAANSTRIPTASATAAYGDPCPLLTPAMLQQAVGMSFGASTETPVPSEGSEDVVQAVECRYEATSARVLFTYVRYDDAAHAMKGYTLSARPVATVVTGLGDAASYDQTDSINVLKGVVSFSVAVAEREGRQLEPERQLAAAITAEL